MMRFQLITDAASLLHDCILVLFILVPLRTLYVVLGIADARESRKTPYWHVDRSNPNEEE